MKRDYLIMLVLLAALIVAPMFIYPVFLMKLLCFALFACAFNLLLGYTGLLSFGHAAFFGGSAYITGHLVRNGFDINFTAPGFLKFISLSVDTAPLTPELGLLAGTAVAAALGFLVGGLAIRRAGIYFAMITLALAQMVYFLALQFPFTGGEDGLQGVPRGRLFGIFDLTQTYTMYFFVLAIFCIGFWIIYRAIHSPFGQVLKAIRENEPRAISLGYDVDKYKLVAFVLSAALSGLAGSTKTLVFQLASLTDVHWHMSGEVVLMTLLGGMGTVFGPIAGAAIVVGLQNYAAGLGEWVTVITGAIFVMCVLAFRRGVVGEIGALFKK
ncbi:MAG: branched-chain amino acid ABC transporter permease [Burkholderiales bacterium]|nr:branched-chain amino acid ABC transporter permease [Burkholderiales bacterium]